MVLFSLGGISDMCTHLYKGQSAFWCFPFLSVFFLEGGFALLFLDKVCARLELALLA